MVVPARPGRVLATATWNIGFRAKLGHMKLHPRVTKSVVELVKRFEGLRRRAARLPDGGWTIGYGHTLTAREGAEVAPDEAELLLFYDLSEVASRIDAWTFTPLNQNQFEALTAFAFNIGLENFRHSTVLKRINEGQHLQAAAAMELWRKTEVAGEGLVADALVRRRAAEKAHYLTPPEGFQPSPSQVLRPIFDYSVIEAAAQSHGAQRAAVVSASLDGDQATARVEHPADTAPATAVPVEVAEAQPAEAEETLLPPTSIFEVAAAAVIAAPARCADDMEVSQAPAAVNDSHNVRLWPDESAAAAPVFRGFEPPPRRFGRANGALPPAANEALGLAAPFGEGPAADARPNGDHWVESAPASPAPEHPGDFNLFDRPLAPPEATRPSTFESSSAPVLMMGDDGVLGIVGGLGDGVDVAGKPRSSVIGSIMHDRTVLFSAIGLIGVALFTLAIFSMLAGKATPWHLLIGILGVALITPAGMFFLMRRMGEASYPVQDPDYGYNPDEPA